MVEILSYFGIGLLALAALPVVMRAFFLSFLWASGQLETPSRGRRAAPFRAPIHPSPSRPGGVGAGEVVESVRVVDHGAEPAVPESRAEASERSDAAEGGAVSFSANDEPEGFFAPSDPERALQQRRAVEAQRSSWTREAPQPRIEPDFGASAATDEEEAVTAAQRAPSERAEDADAAPLEASAPEDVAPVEPEDGDSRPVEREAAPAGDAPSVEAAEPKPEEPAPEELTPEPEVAVEAGAAEAAEPDAADIEEPAIGDLEAQAKRDAAEWARAHAELAEREAAAKRRAAEELAERLRFLEERERRNRMMQATNAVIERAKARGETIDPITAFSIARRELAEKKSAQPAPQAEAGRSEGDADQASKP